MLYSASSFSCLIEIHSSQTNTSIKELSLKKSDHEKFLKLFKESRNQEKFSRLLEEIESHSLFSFRRKIGFKSSQILEVFTYLDEINFDLQKILAKSLRGEKLSLVEKRAFFLLKTKKLWFKEGVYKRPGFLELDSYSVSERLSAVFKKIEGLGPSSEFDKILNDLSSESFLEKLFGTFYYSEQFKKRIAFLETIKDSSLLKEEIAHVQKELLKNSEDKKRVIQFHLDQLKIIESLLKEGDMANLKVRYSSLFIRIPDAFQSIESLSRTMLLITGFIYFVDFSLKKIFKVKELENEDIHGESLPSLIESRSKKTPEESHEEDLEEQFNSGLISFEQYLELSKISD